MIRAQEFFLSVPDFSFLFLVSVIKGYLDRSIKPKSIGIIAKNSYTKGLVGEAYPFFVSGDQSTGAGGRARADVGNVGCR
jgi:hypothetical protein